MSAEKFNGFPRDCLTFFQDLTENNDRDWFAENKTRYEDSVLGPARQFVGALGEALHTLSPNIIADPRVNRSLFRIYRDVRFGKNKDPYKTNLAMFFWEGSGKRMESSGYYFHLESDMLLIGTGLYRFPKPVLDAYRDAVDDDEQGGEFAQIVEGLETSFGSTVGGKATKRVPRGYAKDHPRARLLKHQGIVMGTEIRPVPDALYSAELIDMCMEHYTKAAPLHVWLRDVIANAEEDDA